MSWTLSVQPALDAAGAVHHQNDLPGHLGAIRVLSRAKEFGSVRGLDSFLDHKHRLAGSVRAS